MTTLPLSNVKDDRFATVARSLDANAYNTIINVDFGAPKFIRVFAIPAHNLTATATVKFEAADNPSYVLPAVTTDVDAWPIIYPYGSLPYGHPSWWTGQAIDEDKALYSPLVLLILPAAVQVQYCRISITDTANPQGFVQLGNLFIAPAWEPSRGADYGAALGLEDTSLVEQNRRGGAMFVEPSVVKRTADVNFNGLSRDEARGVAFEFLRQSGKTKPYLFAFDITDSVNRIRSTFFAVNDGLNPVTVPEHFDVWRASIKAKEWV